MNAAQATAQVKSAERRIAEERFLSPPALREAISGIMTTESEPTTEEGASRSGMTIPDALPYSAVASALVRP